MHTHAHTETHTGIVLNLYLLKKPSEMAAKRTHPIAHTCTLACAHAQSKQVRPGASVFAVVVGEPPVSLHHLTLSAISPAVLPPPPHPLPLPPLISDFLLVWTQLHSWPLNSALFQVLLSQVHRLRALDLLGRFLDLGPWAVSLVRSHSVPV